MKITRVGTTAFADRSPDCLVEIQVDDGFTGVAVGPGVAGAEAQELGTQALVGEDPRAVTALWQKIQSGKSESHSTALLDLALWDLKAKLNGEPLWKTLGGARPRANAYVRFDGSSLDDEETLRRYTRLVEQYGFREAKLGVGADIASDAKRLAMLRDVLLQNTAYPVLMIDSGDRWTSEQAISNIKVLEQRFDLTWVECSDGVWDQEDLRQVSGNVFAAVCGIGFSALDPHVADIVQLDLLTTGITGALQIADAAYGFELPVTLSASPGNIATHLAAALPNFMNMEVRDPGSAEEFFTSDVSIENGRAVSRDEPGLGLNINRDALPGAAG
jgi:L-alanine-DL-glutamate epimerase-like enolase superfamily enzyme